MWKLLLIVAGIITALHYPNWRRNRQIQRWRQSLALDEHEPHYQALYADVNGFALSRSARCQQDDIAFIYGEIKFNPFIALLSLCPIGPETVFYDLGSGTGKAVLACAMVFDIQKSCGIELFPELHQAAEQQRLRLQQVPAYYRKASQCYFKQANFLDEVFDDASIIFINATAFFGDYWQTISHHLEQLKPGTFVISTSKAIQSSGFICEKVTSVEMSWGIVTAYIQRRRA